ncbi:hypothetical protein Tco_1491346 [Tanacetum coccineum]
MISMNITSPSSSLVQTILLLRGLGTIRAIQASNSALCIVSVAMEANGSGLVLVRNEKIPLDEVPVSGFLNRFNRISFVAVVLRSFPVEKIEQESGSMILPIVEMDPVGRRSKQIASLMR